MSQPGFVWLLILILSKTISAPHSEFKFFQANIKKEKVASSTAATEEHRPWLCAVPWPSASPRATGDQEQEREQLRHHCHCFTKRTNCVQDVCGFALMRGGPWSCSRFPRTSQPSASSRKEWGHTFLPRGRMRSWAMFWPPCGKWWRRRTEPFPSVHNKTFSGGEKKRKKEKKKSRSGKKINCQRGWLAYTTCGTRSQELSWL